MRPLNRGSTVRKFNPKNSRKKKKKNISFTREKKKHFKSQTRFNFLGMERNIIDETLANGERQISKSRPPENDYGARNEKNI